MQQHKLAKEFKRLVTLHFFFVCWLSALLLITITNEINIIFKLQTLIVSASLSDNTKEKKTV